MNNLSKMLFLVAVISGGSSTHALSIRTAGDELWDILIPHVNLSGLDRADALAELGIRANEAGTNLEFSIHSGVLSNDILPDGFEFKRIALAHILRFVLDGEDAAWAAEWPDPRNEREIEVVIYQPISVQSIRIVSSLPLKHEDEAFLAEFQIVEALKEESLPGVVDCRYSSEIDMMQISVIVNRIAAKKYPIGTASKFPADVGLLCVVKTDSKPIIFGIDGFSAGFLNVDGIEVGDWVVEGMLERVKYLLPVEYSHRINECMESGRYIYAGRDAKGNWITPETPENK